MSKPKDLTMPELKEVKGNMAFPKTPGQVACDTAYNHNVIQFGWTGSTSAQKATWEIVAQAAIDAQPCPHPWEYVKPWGKMVDCGFKCTKCGKEL